MAIKEQINDWRCFWGEVLTMWRKEHGLTLANVLRASFPLAVLSLIVVIVSTVNKNDTWKTWSQIALGISVFISVFDFCFILSFKKYQQFKDKLAWLINLEMIQRAELGNYLSCYIHDIDYSDAKGFSPTLRVTILLVNRSVFPVSNRHFHSIESNLAGNSLPAPRDKPPQYTSPGEITPYVLTFQITPDFVSKLRECGECKQFVDFSMSLVWVFNSQNCGDTNLKANLLLKHLPIIPTGGSL